MGKMKLIYFNARGRAELARLILAQAGEDYIDERVERDDWPKLKSSKIIMIIYQKFTYLFIFFILDCKISSIYIASICLYTAMPGGQMPALEVDGVKLGQSMTIARFLANKFNLAGSTPLEKAQADYIVDCATDFFNGKSEEI